MTREEILAGLKEVLGVIRPKTDLSNIEDSTRLVHDLGIDSLETVEMVMELEEELDTELELDEKVSTVGELVAFIEKKLAE